MDSSTLRVRGFVSNPGMLYELLFRARSTGGSVGCVQFPVPSGFPPNATLTVTNAKEAWVTWVGGTEYSMDAGDAAHNFSFKGPDPHAALVALLSPQTTVAYAAILAQHVSDYKATLTTPFSLSIGQKPQLDLTTDALKAGYQIDTGNPYLEWLIFNYGRYLLMSSARGALPANLQGKWANGYGNAWSAGAHECCNLHDLIY